MISFFFDEAFSDEWISAQITDDENELVILRQVIPWNSIIKSLSSFYNSNKGRVGKSLRISVALLILMRFRHLSDRKVVSSVKENRYMQYFCNVSDEKLANFVHYSTICRFRKRLGQKGISVIENKVFEHLKQAGVIQDDTLLMDSTVLSNNIIYPTDVLLIYKAFLKMASFAKKHSLLLWWDHAHIKKREARRSLRFWRGFGLDKKGKRAVYLAEFHLLFVDALSTFRTHIAVLEFSSSEKQEAISLVEILSLLEIQTQKKLAGARHIENRIVSLDEIEARPIKKGKSHPSCEFGTTVQMTFNRQGFMITTENFIGNPSDKKLYENTLELFLNRMETCPNTLVTDLGFRSEDNFNNTPEEVSNLFLGKSDDVSCEQKEYCLKSRSATEGFIAVAKNLHGFGKSLYRLFVGDKIWTLLCQTAYNLKKILQLLREEKIDDGSKMRLGLLT